MVPPERTFTESNAHDFAIKGDFEVDSFDFHASVYEIISNLESHYPGVATECSVSSNHTLGMSLGRGKVNEGV